MARIHIFKRGAAALTRLLPASRRFRVCGVPDAEPPAPAGATVPDVQTILHGTGSHIGGHLDAQDRLLAEGPLKWAEPLRQRFILRQRFFPPVREVQGTAWSLATVSATNYFHWMFECLPRLRFLRESNIPYDWIYACHNQRFQREAFAHLGLPAEKIIDTASVPFLRAERIVLPRRIDKFEPWIIPWLRETLLPLGQTATGATLPKRIYISRRKASSRGVGNDAELTALLELHGFVEVRLEEHSLAEQIALFRHAEAIVAPHGAGLTNLIFCEPGTLVVEFIAVGYAGSELYAIFGQRQQLNYHLLQCPPQDPAKVHASAVLVDVLHVRTILESLQIAKKISVSKREQA